MGIAANQARLMSITARQSDLELRAQQISAVKMRKSQDSSSTATAYSEALNKYSQEMQEAAKLDGSNRTAAENTAKANLQVAQGTYDTATSKLSAEEKVLDMELTQINTEHTAVKTEYDAIKTLIGDNTEKSFNVFG